MDLDNLYRLFLWGVVIFLAVLAFGFLLRVIIGPRFTDRIVAVNVISNKAAILIVIISFLIKDSGLLDIALVYSMISFLGVVVLAKCFALPPSGTRASKKKEEAAQ